MCCSRKSIILLSKITNISYFTVSHYIGTEIGLAKVRQRNFSSRCRSVCNGVDQRHCLRNRNRVACVYGMIMHAGNVERIREKRLHASRVFSQHSPSALSHYKRTGRVFSCNMSRRYCIVNNFIQKVDVECTQ